MYKLGSTRCLRRLPLNFTLCEMKSPAVRPVHAGLKESSVLKKTTQPATSGQQIPVASPDEILNVLNEFRGSGAFPVKSELLDSLSKRCAKGKLTFEDARNAIRAVMLDGGAVEQAMDAVKGLFQPGDIVEFCAISPQGGVVALQGDPHDAKPAAKMAEFVRNQLGYANLYVGICPRQPHMSGQRRRAKNADVFCRRHVVLDLDDKDAPDTDAGWLRTVEALRQLGPALSVRSGNGWQIWFNIEVQGGEDLHQSAPAISEALAVIGADSTGDLSRLMRLPYTLNVPNDSKRRKGRVVRFASPVDAMAVQEAAA